MGAKFDFKSLEQPLEVDWPVSVQVPQDGGTFEAQTFTARFKILGKAEAEEMVAEIQKGAAVDPFAWINSFWVGLGGREDETLSSAMREEMLSRGYIREAIVAAYRDCARVSPTKN